MSEALERGAVVAAVTDRNGVCQTSSIPAVVCLGHRSTAAPRKRSEDARPHVDRADITNESKQLACHRNDCLGRDLHVATSLR